MKPNWIKIAAPALIVILLEFVAYRLWEGRPYFPTKLERLEEAQTYGPKGPPAKLTPMQRRFGTTSDGRVSGRGSDTRR